MENLNFCIFGDSVGKGVVLSETGRYTSGAPDINLLTGRSDITLENFSRFGFVTEKTLSLVEKCESDIASSDAVFIEVGGNDCDFDWQSISDTPEEEHLCKTRLFKISKQKNHRISPVISFLGFKQIKRHKRLRAFCCLRRVQTLQRRQQEQREYRPSPCRHLRRGERLCLSVLRLYYLLLRWNRQTF